jgi:capsular polysaccharide export protein
MDQIAVLTRGLWRLKREIAALTGLHPVRWDTWPRPSFVAVAGWGHRPTADRARKLAERRGVPYLAFEDGPIRSVRPGPEQPPIGMVVDRAGIYYAAAQPSDLLDFAADRGWFTPEKRARAQAALDLLRRLKLSKYNSGPERTPAQLGLDATAKRRVLVLDQVHSDASIAGALADADAFANMLAGAQADEPAAEIVVKLHPDVLSGRKAGYFSELKAAGRLRLVAEPVNPWSLLEAVDTVYTVSSGLGFEAALAGTNVVCYGAPFYSGWGFTEDRGPKLVRPHSLDPPDLFAAYYLRYSRYFDPWSRHEVSFEEAAEQLAWLRDSFLAQSSRAVCYRITRWKRSQVGRMLDGPAGAPIHTRDVATAVEQAGANRGHVVAWASRDLTRLEAETTEHGVELKRVEDGFVRSAGLGASFVLPLSLVFDARGIFYDSRSPSDLEALLQEGEFSPELIARARRLREKLVAAGTTKYNVAAHRELSIDSGGRPVILVPGQVEDDASIHKGSPVIKRNFDLLEAVRARHPDGCIVYKPHPDVEAGLRRGRVPRKVAAQFADRIVTKGSILALIARADRVETMTSLAGFEALLRGKPVTTHGQPFYAGWSLTEDLCSVPRRTRRRSLDELVAASLILYPRYLDPVSGLPCRAELLIERLAAEAQRKRGGLERVLRLAQVSAGRALHLGHSVRRFARGA